MSTIGKVVGAITRQGIDRPIDVAMKISVAAWIVAGFLLLTLVTGVMAGAAQ